MIEDDGTYDPRTRIHTNFNGVKEVKRTTCPVLVNKPPAFINMYWTGMMNFRHLEKGHSSLDDIPIDMYHWANLVGYISDIQSRKVYESKSKAKVKTK